jgi:hypothetical protein
MRPPRRPLSGRGEPGPNDWPTPPRAKAGGVSARLDPESSLANNGPAVMTVHIIECPDPEGHRWRRALELLLDAGRGRQATDSAA